MHRYSSIFQISDVSYVKHRCFLRNSHIAIIIFFHPIHVYRSSIYAGAVSRLISTNCDYDQLESKRRKLAWPTSKEVLISLQTGEKAID